jgi:hypothetical protein
MRGGPGDTAVRPSAWKMEAHGEHEEQDYDAEEKRMWSVEE